MTNKSKCEAAALVASQGIGELLKVRAKKVFGKRSQSGIAVYLGVSLGEYSKWVQSKKYPPTQYWKRLEPLVSRDELKAHKPKRRRRKRPLWKSKSLKQLILVLKIWRPNKKRTSALGAIEYAYVSNLLTRRTYNSLAYWVGNW